MSTETKADATQTIGTILNDSGQRDAIHVAVISVVSGQSLPLSPGNHVGFFPDGFVGTQTDPWVGIVDPFLDCQVKKGERFWLCVYPRTITGLRHVWTHPTISGEDPIAKSASPEQAKRIAAEAWWREPTDQGYPADYDRIIEIRPPRRLE